MKNSKKYILTLLLTAFFALVKIDVYAQAEWTVYEYTTKRTVSLKTNVILTEPIVIKKGGDLTIENTSGSTLSILNGQGANGLRMFVIESGGILRIKGTDDNNKIIIDGGANFSKKSELDVKDYTASNADKKLYEAILNKGMLSMNYACIQNVCGTRDTHGGAIQIYCASSSEPNQVTIIDHTIIRNCVAPNGSAIIIHDQTKCTSNTAESCKVTIRNCEIYYNNALGENSTSGGGTIRTYGSAVGILHLNNNIIRNNRSVNGGGLYWNGSGHSETTCIIEGCTFSKNTATNQGGAMLLESTFEFTNPDQTKATNKKTVVSGNTAADNGGGISITGYTGPLIKGGTLNFSFSDKLEVTNNTAAYGGGISFYFGKMTFTQKTNINTIINGCTISNNTATEQGGAICFRNSSKDYDQSHITINIKMCSGTFENNKTDGYGGALYVNNTDILYRDNAVSSDLVTIKDNRAQLAGGGIFLDSGNLTFHNCNITGNRTGYNASGSIINNNANGGAICVNQGSITIDKGDISGNYATKNGGAIYVNNTDFTNQPKTITMVGSGVFQKNQASNGGGMYVSGNIQMTFAGSIINNKSTNGGGIYLTNGAQLNITGGILRQNRAVGLAGQPKPVTGYQVSSSNLHGLGGGIYIDNGRDASHLTKLTFDLTKKSIGIYDNNAEWGADDVFASGQNTLVTLPNINQMTITDFDIPTETPLYWEEDYITDDPNYQYGTKLKPNWSSDQTNDRYDYAIRNSKPTYHLVFGQSETTKTLDKYLSLQVGYEIIFVTLVKKGLYPGESATFTFTPANKKVSDTEYEVVPGTKPYQNVLFVCKNSSETTNGVVRKIAVPRGWWKIDESLWSWAYEAENGEKYDKPIIIDATNNYLEFYNKRKTTIDNGNEEIPIPNTSESIVTNEMKSSVTVISTE